MSQIYFIFLIHTHVDNTLFFLYIIRASNGNDNTYSPRSNLTKNINVNLFKNELSDKAALVQQFRWYRISIRTLAMAMTPTCDIKFLLYINPPCCIVYSTSEPLRVGTSLYS